MVIFNLVCLTEKSGGKESICGRMMTEVFLKGKFQRGKRFRLGFYVKELWYNDYNSNCVHCTSKVISSYFGKFYLKGH